MAILFLFLDADFRPGRNPTIGTSMFVETRFLAVPWNFQGVATVVCCLMESSGPLLHRASSTQNIDQQDLLL